MELAFLAGWGPGIFLLAFSFWARLFSFPVITTDYTYFLAKWFDTLGSSPGLTAFAQPFADYAPAYLYIIKGLTFLPFYSLYTIKSVSIFFDLLIAVTVSAILYFSGEKRWSKLFLAFSIMCTVPTVVLNSSLWGQADSTYSAFVLLSLGFILAQWPLAATLAFAIGFAFKFQAIFFLPFLFGYLFRRRETLSYILLVPIVFFITVVPAWLSGGSLLYWIFIYFKQATQYTELAVSAHTLFAFIEPLGLSAAAQNVVFMAGVGITCVVALVMAVLVARAGLSSRERMILLALLCVTIIPFLLPRMHERYLYLADIISVLYALYRPSRWYLPVLVVGASILSYLPYLSQLAPLAMFNQFDLRIPATMMVCAIALMVIDLVRMPEIEPRHAS